MGWRNVDAIRGFYTIVQDSYVMIIIVICKIPNEKEISQCSM